jgi:predicted flap endonuclease-1-like 5' DNA nuclease
MNEFLTSNVALLVVALVLAVLVALWMLAANRKTRIELTPPQDDTPAKRNQALIDAPPAAVTHPEVGMVPLMEPDATIVAMPPPEPVSAPAAAPVPSPSPASGGDDLLLIKGLGPKLKSQMADLGVTTFAQIAAWSEADIDRIDAQLGRFQGRIRRESWVEQAKLLAAGDKAGFAQRFGNN